MNLFFSLCHRPDSVERSTVNISVLVALGRQRDGGVRRPRTVRRGRRSLSSRIPHSVDRAPSDPQLPLIQTQSLVNSFTSFGHSA